MAVWSFEFSIPVTLRNPQENQRFWRSRGPPGGVLGASWGLLWASWGRLGGVWGATSFFLQLSNSRVRQLYIYNTLSKRRFLRNCLTLESDPGRLLPWTVREMIIGVVFETCASLVSQLSICEPTVRKQRYRKDPKSGNGRKCPIWVGRALEKCIRDETASKE